MKLESYEVDPAVPEGLATSVTGAAAVQVSQQQPPAAGTVQQQQQQWGQADQTATPAQVQHNTLATPEWSVIIDFDMFRYSCKS